MNFTILSWENPQMQGFGPGFWDSMVSVVYTGLEHMFSHYEPGGFPRIWTAPAFPPSLWRHRMVVHGTVGKRSINTLIPESCDDTNFAESFDDANFFIATTSDADKVHHNSHCGHRHRHHHRRHHHNHHRPHLIVSEWITNIPVILLSCSPVVTP